MFVRVTDTTKLKCYNLPSLIVHKLYIDCGLINPTHLPFLHDFDFFQDSIHTFPLVN
jgi:hypothetical protein